MILSFSDRLRQNEGYTMHKYQIRYTVGASNECQIFEGEYAGPREAIEAWVTYCEKFEDKVQFIDCREYAA
jgi:hypothetical protein